MRDSIRRFGLLVLPGELSRLKQQRSYLFGAGVPASFLPGAVGMGRADLG